MLEKYTLSLIQVESVVLPQARGTCEPSESEYGDADHSEQEAEGLLFHETHGAAASRTDVVGHRSVRSGLIHAELETFPSSKVASLCRSGDVLLRIVDDQSVSLGEKRSGTGSLVRAGVPDDSLQLLERLVGSNCVHRVVGGAGSEDVDVLRLARQGCVVPNEGDLVVDFVIARGRHGVWGDHGSTAWRHSGIKHACRRL
jgi:hypothetical protein